MITLLQLYDVNINKPRFRGCATVLYGSGKSRHLIYPTFQMRLYLNSCLVTYQPS